MNKTIDKGAIKKLNLRLGEAMGTGYAKLHFNEISNLIDLYKRQQAEIKATKYYYNNCLKDLKNAHAEVKRLSLENAVLQLRRNVFDQRIQSEAIKDILLTLEAEARSSDKYLEEYDDSKEQKAYNQALWKAYNLAKEIAGEQK